MKWNRRDREVLSPFAMLSSFVCPLKVHGITAGGSFDSQRGREGERVWEVRERRRRENDNSCMGEISQVGNADIGRGGTDILYGGVQS